MPHNSEAEGALIGGLLTGYRDIEALGDKLMPEDFYHAVHGRIYRACLMAHAAGSNVNPITIRPFMAGDPALKELGGDAYLVKLTTTSVGLIGVRDFADQIIELAKRRRLIEAMLKTIERAVDTAGDNPISAIMEDADNSLSQILDRDMDDASGIKQVSAAQAFREMVDAYNAPANGVTCGIIPCVDDTLGHIRPHHLVIAAGRPGMGKTAFALSYAIGAAQRGHGVLFVSLEMSRMELMQRATADVCFDGRFGVPYEMIRDGRFGSDDDKRRVYAARRVFDDLPLNIIDAGSLTIGRLNMLVRRWKRRMEARGQSLDLVVVDYLQLLRPDGRTSGNYEAVSEVSRGLKAIAKTHDLGVMALAQLSRAVEQRPDKRPMLSDLRDSGQIEQDADAVLFLYRAEYYLRMAMPPENDPKHHECKAALEEVSRKIEFIVAKRRNGCSGTAHGLFHGAFQAVRGEE